MIFTKLDMVTDKVFKIIRSRSYVKNLLRSFEKKCVSVISSRGKIQWLAEEQSLRPTSADKSHPHSYRH